LVEMMGGQIGLHSPGLDQGTTVKVTLPLLNLQSLHDPELTSVAESAKA
jgi:signal transduction histidine kinase